MSSFASQWQHVMEPGFPISFFMPAGTALHLHWTDACPVQVFAKNINGETAPDFDQCFLADISTAAVTPETSPRCKPYWPDNIGPPSVWTITPDFEAENSVVLHAKQDAFTAINQPAESQPLYFRIVHVNDLQ
jgi:hypothetical protein